MTFMHLPKSTYQEVTSVLTKISSFYAHCLTLADLPLQYCLERGIDFDTIQTFDIGYAPGISKLTSFLDMNSISRETAALSGNFRFTDDSYDKFTDRIVFPVHDLQGSVVAFSGRWFHSDLANTPKYLNSPSSYVFKKSLFLYGLYQALPAAKEQNFVILVEGNVDVISVAKSGFSNVVAPCGTAFTLSQALILRNFVGTVIGCFDNDMPGRKAAKRAKDTCNSAGCVYYDLVVPGAKDPDEFIQKSGAEAFQKLVQSI